MSAGADVLVIGRDLPDVAECFDGHLLGHRCPQDDGGHDHVWRLCVPEGAPYARVAARCQVCGGRRCDAPGCSERRHHRAPHRLPGGVFLPVGA